MSKDTRLEVVAMSMIILSIVLTGVAVYLIMQNERYSGPAEVVVREYRDEYRLKVCMIETGACRWAEVPRAIYEVRHEGTVVELDDGKVLYTDNMRP